MFATKFYPKLLFGLICVMGLIIHESEEVDSICRSVNPSYSSSISFNLHIKCKYLMNSGLVRRIEDILKQQVKTLLKLYPYFIHRIIFFLVTFRFATFRLQNHFHRQTDAYQMVEDQCIHTFAQN